jgi:hypothetical protein
MYKSFVSEWKFVRNFRGKIVRKLFVRSGVSLNRSQVLQELPPFRIDGRRRQLVQAVLLKSLGRGGPVVQRYDSNYYFSSKMILIILLPSIFRPMYLHIYINLPSPTLTYIP